ncbi:MAG: hypothetical protein IPH82_09915 [Chloroflexi bacterium]|nr:hypothetical protein [Chloroflexota bacterium]
MARRYLENKEEFQRKGRQEAKGAKRRALFSTVSLHLCAFALRFLIGENG